MNFMVYFKLFDHYPICIAYVESPMSLLVHIICPKNLK